MNTIKIKEIFLSLQGESKSVGFPTVFVRLTGCPLRCQYCDTAYAFHGGEKKAIHDIVNTVTSFGVPHVTVTGGEPLAQPACFELLTQLCDQHLIVSIETSGAIPINKIDPRVCIVMDLKTPGSQESQRNHLANLVHLKKSDQIKFVICDRADFDWSIAFIEQYKLRDCCELLFSPSHQQLQPVTLAEWIIAARAPVRMQVQLHKILWGDVPGK